MDLWTQRPWDSWTLELWDLFPAPPPPHTYSYHHLPLDLKVVTSELWYIFVAYWSLKKSIFIFNKISFFGRLVFHTQYFLVCFCEVLFAISADNSKIGHQIGCLKIKPRPIYNVLMFTAQRKVDVTNGMSKWRRRSIDTYIIYESSSAQCVTSSFYHLSNLSFKIIQIHHNFFKRIIFLHLYFKTNSK